MTQEPIAAIGLTAGEAARHLGVAVTTLRSWHRRYGLGPTRHTRGRHRRYGADDLARLEIMRTLTSQGVPAVEAARMALAGVLAPRGETEDAGPAVASADRSVRGLTSAAMRLDAVRARELMNQALVAAGVVATWDEVVCPVLARIASRHVATDSMVEVEHLFSRTVSEALAAVERPAAGEPVRVLLACADEEQHSLPLEALAAALAERGVGTRLLGARVPPPALQAAVRRTGPALVAVWSHAPATADPKQLLPLASAPTRHSLVAAVGPGWGNDLPDGVLRPETLAEAVELAAAVARAGWHAG